jgi:xylan 1,4-beta-xylosidase
MKKELALLLTGMVAAWVHAERGKTYCNPLDVDYRYGTELPQSRVNFPGESLTCRASADPVIINHEVDGRSVGYYMVATSARGYWKSKDLAHWEHVSPDNWPSSYSREEGRDMIAPTALSVDGKFYVMPSSHDTKSPIYISSDPEHGKFEVFNPSLTFPAIPNPPGLWDPALFHDEDAGRWYLYWGSSHTFPIVGAELSMGNKLDIATYPRSLIYLYPEQHGWERFGRDHRDEHMPSYIEGAWMTKYGGKYYLQYGAPGTSENMYANGTYVGDSPLGPFVYAPYNQVSYKPGGYVIGVGHGNTFRDKYGNYWNTGTCWIGVNWVFERRMTMVPAGFDADGQMYADTRFADFPHFMPNKKWQNSSDLFAGWMLLSYKKPCTASSQRPGEAVDKNGLRYDFKASNATDENPRTFWVAGNNRAGEALVIDLEQLCDIRAFQINYSDFMVKSSDLLEPRKPDAEYVARVYTHYKMHVSVDGREWVEIGNNTHEKTNRSNPYVELKTPVKARYVKFENIHVPAENLAVGDIRIFGNGQGEAPVTPSGFRVGRDPDDSRNALVEWKPVGGAVGYNILWGIRPDKLYQTYQVWADVPAELELRALGLRQDYYFAIEAFNENGVSKPSRVVKSGWHVDN